MNVRALLRLVSAVFVSFLLVPQPLFAQTGAIVFRFGAGFSAMPDPLPPGCLGVSYNFSSELIVRFTNGQPTAASATVRSVRRWFPGPTCGQPDDVIPAHQATVQLIGNSLSLFDVHMDQTVTLQGLLDGSRLHNGFFEISSTRYSMSVTLVGWVLFGQQQQCRANVTRVGQCDQPWGPHQYAFSSSTMCGLGCATTSLSMSLSAAGIGGIPVGNNQVPLLDPQFPLVTNTPGTLNTYMKSLPSRRLYGPGNITHFTNTTLDLNAQLFRTGRITKRMRFRTPLGPTLRGILPAPPSDPATAFLDDALCQGYAVVVKVPSPTRVGRDHFVVVTGQDGADYTIADPAPSPLDPSLPFKTKLSGYPTFEIRGYVEDPVDVSTLVVAAGDGTSILVEDSLGNRTGRDAADSLHFGIANASFFEDDIMDESGATEEVARGSGIYIEHPQPGSYSVMATNPHPGVYSMDVSLYSPDGTPLPVAQLSAFGTITTRFEIQLPQELDAAPVTARSVSFDSFLAEISSASEAGLIRDSNITRTLETLTRTAKRLATEDKTTHVSIVLLNVVRELIRTHTTSGRIDTMASQLLQQDCGELIRHLHP